MDKVLVEVVCAATEKKYDFLLPGQMKAGTALKKIMEQIMLYEANAELFTQKAEYLLIEQDTEAVLNDDYTLEQAGITGGNTLILI